MRVASDPGVKRARGFTIVELVTVIAIVGIVAALAWSNFSRQKPRANLMGAAVELESLLRNARQNAITRGIDTIVLVFPNAASPTANSVGGVGRFITVEDGAHTFFTGTPTNLSRFDPAIADGGTGFGAAVGALIGTFDLPAGITVGIGSTVQDLSATPYAGITVSDCSFCTGSGTSRRGAIAFDARGRARFYSPDANTPLAAQGASLAIQGTDAIGYRLLVITPATGGVRLFTNG